MIKRDLKSKLAYKGDKGDRESERASEREADKMTECMHLFLLLSGLLSQTHAL